MINSYLTGQLLERKLMQVGTTQDLDWLNCQLSTNSTKDKVKTVTPTC
jgi:hypothetical protein